MFVRQFVNWVRTAPAAERAEATADLARSFLYSDMEPHDRRLVDAALTLMLDDPSPLVRGALAETLSRDEGAPRHLVLALAGDQPDVAAIVVEHSPVLLDVELVDFVGGGCRRVHLAAARRQPLSRAVAAAIAEVGDAYSISVLLENPHAAIAAMTLSRIVDRHGDDAEIRDLLLARDTLPSALRQTLVVKLGAALSDFVAARSWLGAERATEIARDACEKATIRLAAVTKEEELLRLVGHLRRTGQLNAAFLMRTLCAGETRLFLTAMAELAAMPLHRVAALVHDRRGNGLRAVYARAKLPPAAYPAFAAALDVLDGRADPSEEPAAFARLVVDRILARYSEGASESLDHLTALLRRFAADAAREEARRTLAFVEAA